MNPSLLKNETGLCQTRVDSPLGPMLAIASDAGLHGLWFDGQKHHPGPTTLPEAAADARWRLSLQALLSDYFEGRGLPPMPAPDLPLALRGTDFQQRVWQALLAVPCGGTSTYGTLARSLGKPGAARAVGAAVGRNPVSILVPCHRILGDQGQLTGYAGGLDRKRHLLSLEASPDLFAVRRA